MAYSTRIAPYDHMMSPAQTFCGHGPWAMGGASGLYALAGTLARHPPRADCFPAQMYGATPPRCVVSFAGLQEVGSVL